MNEPTAPTNFDHIESKNIEVQIFNSRRDYDKQIKPLILKWLSKLFGYKNYPHSYKDQFISWDVYDGDISISFDLRQEEHLKLLSLIHPSFLGCPQKNTLKIVNEKVFYLDIKSIINIEFPDIIAYKKINEVRHKDDEGDVFYTYEWNIELSNGKHFIYRNQKDKMDMVKGDFTYTTTINEISFIDFMLKTKH